MKKSISSIVLTSLSLIELSLASSTFRLDIVKNQDVEAAQILRRDGTVFEALTNGMSLYYANVTVGTPGQSFSLQIDTGSSDVWFPSVSNPTCVAGGCIYGSFNPNQSSTYTLSSTGNFNISYGDGTGATGDYFQDTLTVGGQSIMDFEMALATNTTIKYGLIGIGYRVNEAGVGDGNITIHPNVADGMVSSGLIQTQAYSLWLNDPQSSTGSVLFGGIDTDKYTGSLSSLTTLPGSGLAYTGSDITQFLVALTSVSATSSSGSDSLTSSGFAIAVLLDSGSTNSILPTDIAQSIFNEVGATLLFGYAVVPCALAQKNGTINYTFGGPNGVTVKVPVRSLISSIPPEANALFGGPPTYPDGGLACILGVEDGAGRSIILGDTFLRNAYVVYDLVNNRIGLGQSNVNSTSSNIVAFPSSGAPIPSATTPVNEVTSVTIPNATAINAPSTVGIPTALPSGFTLTYKSVPTSLSAASGFAVAAATKGSGSTPTGSSIASSTASSHANYTGEAAVGTSNPFEYMGAGIMVTSVAWVLLGAGIFAWL